MKLLFLAALVALSSCGGSQRARIETESRADVSSDSKVTDERFRFRLSSADDAWRVYGPEEASTAAPEALALAVSPGLGLVGTVVVERTGEVKLADYLGHVLAGFAMAGDETAVLEPVTFAGVDAARLRLEGRLAGDTVRAQVVAFLKDGFVYRLTAVGPLDGVDEEYEVFAPFFDGFELLPGDIGEARVPSAPDADGFGWRVRGGRFEDGVCGLILVPPHGWELVVGEELRATGAGDARVMLRHEIAYVQLQCDQGVDDPQRYLADRRVAWEEQMAGASLEPVQIEVDGVPLVLHRSRSREGLPVELQRGIVTRGERVTRVSAWFPKGLAAEAQEVIAEALGGLRVLDAAERAALLAQTAPEAIPKVAVGEGYALVGERLVHFAGGLEWSVTGGPWRISLGARARRINPSATVILEDVTHGVYCVVVVEPVEMGAAEYHERVVASMFGGEGDTVERRDAPMKLGDFDALEAVGSRARTGGFVHRVITTVSERRAIQVVFGGFPGAMRRGAPTMRALLDGLRVQPLSVASVEEGPGTFRDRRFGVAFDAPSTGYSLERGAVAWGAAVGEKAVWSHAEAPNVWMVTLFDERRREGADEEIVSGLSDEIASSVGAAFAGVPAVRAQPIEGIEWTARDYGGGLVTYATDRGPFWYLLVVVPHGGAAVTVDPRSGFRFLE